MGTISLGKKSAVENVVETSTESVTVGTPSVKESGSVSKSRLRATVREGVLAQDPSILCEDEGKRTTHSKIYRRNDGTVQQVVTGYPVHYANEGEIELREIDNTLVDAGDCYETKAGRYRFSIAKNISQSGTLKMHGNGISIAWDFLPKRTTGVTARAVSVSKSRLISKKPIVGVIYENAADTTDIEYSIAGESVKENIIVRDRREEYRYTFLLTLDGVTPRLSQDGTKIEFYKTADESVGAFAEIPAPYMYDVAGEKNEEVYYELEETAGGYAFTVIADAEWINAENRAFPVTIDPQIAVKDQPFFTVESERRTLTKDGTVTKWGNWASYTPSEISVSFTSTEEKKCTIKIPYNRLNLLDYPVSSVKLTLHKQSGTGKNILVNNAAKSVSDFLIVDITSTVKKKQDYEATLGYSNGALTFYSNGTNAPTLDITYLINEGVRQTFKTIQLVGNVSAEIEVNTGETAVSFSDVSANDTPLGVGMYHVHKLSGENFHCGKNFRLNLHERIDRDDSDSYDKTYTYTDAKGFQHGFTDLYYYLDANNKKVYVEKASVTVALNGDMTYGIHEVFLEQLTTSGLKLVTQIDGLNGSEYLEQRADEVKHLEEQVQSYRSALEQYCGGYYLGADENLLKDFLDSNEAFESFMAQSTYFATRDEALSLRSLDQQSMALSNQITSLAYQQESIVIRIKAKEDVDSENDASVDYGSSNPGRYDSNDPDEIQLLHSQYRNLNDIRSDYVAQRNIISDQRTDLVEKLGGTRATIQKYYKEYVNLSYQLKQYKKQIPVSYLTDGSVYKGFNEDGQLVAIYDGYNNTISVIYDDEDKITTVYDGENDQITLSYNAGGLLASMIDTRGRRTVYDYDENGNLVKITRANGKDLKLTYSDAGNVETVTAEDGKSTLIYNGGLASVTNVSTVEHIAHGDMPAAASEILLSSVEIDYTGTNTVFTDQNGNKQYYVFSTDDSLIAYYEETNGVVSIAEKYSYAAYSSETKESAKATLLNRTPYTSFSYVTGEKSVTTLDQFNKPVETRVTGQVVSENTTATTTTIYTYDDEHRCVKETSTVTLSGGATDSYVSVKTYAYNAHGSIVRKESYVEGEQLTKGVSIEETVYDENGNKVKSFQYNSLDTSSKIYTESKYAENGQVTADLDEMGEISAEYEYIEGTAIVRTVKYPNGSRFAYGYDAEDTVTAITQSTAEGEENSTQTYYTCGEVTKLVSGNNTVKYKYDGEHRITAIDLNGTEDYETYFYSEGDTEDSVTATNAKNETFTKVTDKKGQVLRVQYGDVTQVSYTYDADGNVLTAADGVTGENESSTYDSLGNRTAYTRGSYSESFTYDVYGKITSFVQGARTYSYAYKNNAARDLDHITVEGITVTPETDCLGRNKGKEISGADGKIAGEYLYYRKVGDHATNMPSAVYFGNTQSGTYVIRDNVKYEYDASGNICKIFENGALAVRYEYDSIDRLTREDNKKLGTTMLFAYDNCGNILSRRQTSFTLKENVEECEFTETLYSYDGDKLLLFGNEVCEYDEIGNPTTYRGKTVAWAKGRQMTAYDGNTFAYDGQGRRIAKNSITYTYDGSGRLIASSNGLEYLYDNAGVFAVKNGESTYFYRKDAQGNIIALIDSSGNVVVQYVYDAWGNHAVLDANGNDLTESSHIGVLNPFRYRGYFYDVETGLFLVTSRYYDPETGRFISPDDISYLDPSSINGLNLYAYCGNDPVNRWDPTGHSWESFWNGVGNWFKDNWVKLAIGAAFIIGGAVVTFFTAGMGTAGLLAAGGALLASAKAVGISMAVSAGIGAVVGGITGGLEGALQGFGNGLADGFMWGGIFAGSAQILSGVFKIAANAGVATGRKGGIQLTKNIKILSPNNVKFYENGGTLLKIGKNFRFDVGSQTLLHMHLLKFNHVPLGIILSSLFGGIDSIW